MNTLDSTISQISAAYTDCVAGFMDFQDANELPNGDTEESPAILMDALGNLLELLYIHETDNASLSHKELSELGNYGIDLLQRLSEITGELGYPEHQGFEQLSLPLSLWLGAHGAEINLLYPIVSTLARLANRLTDPVDLEKLFAQTTRILDALSIKITQDLQQSEPGSPLSVFLINRAIIATRSLNLDFITFSYQVIRDQLPELAHGFYAEAMEQMELLNYPPEVRALVGDFYNHAKGKALLH